MDDRSAGSGLPGLPSLYEQASCALFLLDDKGTIVEANALFCSWTGLAREDLLRKKRLVDLLTMGGKIFYQTHWAPLLQLQGSVSEVKFTLRPANGGGEMPVIINAVRRASPQGVFDHSAAFVINDRDRYERELLVERQRAEDLLTRERSARSAADQAQGLLNEALSDRALLAEHMIGIVSHDLRNPLSAISVSAALLGMGELSAQQRRVVGRITNSTERAQRMVADLLDFTQARVGRGLVVKPKEVDLKQLIEEAADELSMAFPGRKLKVSHSGKAQCVLDPDRLIQLLGNLVANAMTYGHADEAITIASAVTDAQASVSVHNHGPAIPAERVGMIFEPLSRGTEAATGQRNVGLGLFIVREIARAHGGTVDVRSSADEGTTFTARWPSSPGTRQ